MPAKLLRSRRQYQQPTPTTCRRDPMLLSAIPRWETHSAYNGPRSLQNGTESHYHSPGNWSLTMDPRPVTRLRRLTKVLRKCSPVRNTLEKDLSCYSRQIKSEENWQKPVLMGGFISWARIVDSPTRNWTLATSSKPDNFWQMLYLISMNLGRPRRASSFCASLAFATKVPAMCSWRSPKADTPRNRSVRPLVARLPNGTGAAMTCGVSGTRVALRRRKAKIVGEKLRAI